MPIGSTINTSALKLTFLDDFNSFSASPDGSTGLWRTTYDWGNRTLGSNGEQQYYSDSSVGVNPFSISNGVLDIRAAPGGNPLNLPYNSGAITTEVSFSQLYGYFEIRAELPAGQGLWPAFWLLPADHSWPPELDIFEVLGNSPTTLYFSTHSSVQATQGTTLTVADVSKGFHTYGVMWGPQEVDLYIDGIETAAMPTPADMNKPMYMLANLAVGGYWPGSPNASTPFPADMLIDYVHAYAYPGTAGGTVTMTDPSANIGATNVAPVIVTPSTFGAVAGTNAAFAGVSVTDTWPGGIFSVTVSDNVGHLAVSATTGVLETGLGTASLILSGGLAAINTALATLTYQAAAGTDEYVWISAVDPQGLKQSTFSHATVAAAAPIPVSSTPVVTASASLTLAAGAPHLLTGVSIADTAPSGPITVLVSDSAGTLSTAAASGVTTAGENSKALSLTGTLAAINASLATLTYQAAAGTDWVWISANDSKQIQGIGHTVVTTTASPVVPVPAPPPPPPASTPASISAPAAISITAGTTHAVSGIHIGGTIPAGSVSVDVSDTTGLLQASATAGVILQGQGTAALHLTGKLDAINVALATLTYHAATATGSDWLWVSDNDGLTSPVYGHTVVTTTPPPLTPAPVVTTPATLAVTTGTTSPLAGIKISGGTAGGTVSVVISDSIGHLAVTPANAVVITGQNTTALHLTGTLAAMTADLVGLTYQAGSTPGVDWLWVSANDASGAQGVNSVVVTAQAPNALLVASVSQGLAALQSAGALTGPSATLGLPGATAPAGFGASIINTPTRALGGTVPAPRSASIAALFSGDPAPGSFMHAATDGSFAA